MFGCFIDPFTIFSFRYSLLLSFLLFSFRVVVFGVGSRKVGVGSTAFFDVRFFVSLFMLVPVEPVSSKVTVSTFFV